MTGTPTSTYVFGFVAAGAGLPEDDTMPGLRRLTVGSVDAVVGSPPGGALPEQVRSHAYVVQRLMASAGGVLPCRFGSVLADDAAVRAEITNRLPQLRAALDVVQGRVELAVRANWVGEAAEPAVASAVADVGVGRGRAWLEQRAHRLATADRLHEQVHGTLARQAARARWRAPVREGTPATGSYLVDRAAVPRVVELAEGLAERADLQLSCTGPWPPYSFTDVAETAEEDGHGRVTV